MRTHQGTRTKNKMVCGVETACESYLIGGAGALLFITKNKMMNKKKRAVVVVGGLLVLFALVGVVMSFEKDDPVYEPVEVEVKVTAGDLLDQERKLQFQKDEYLKKINILDQRILEVRKQRNAMEKPDYLVGQAPKQQVKEKVVIKKEVVKQLPSKPQLHNNNLDAVKANAISLGMKEGIITHIIEQCKTAIDSSHCVKYAVAVSNAESSMFKNAYVNNGFGLMKKGKVIAYGSVEANIADRVARYNRYRKNNNTPQEWLSRSNYCTSGCKYWIKNVQSTLNKLNA